MHLKIVMCVCLTLLTMITLASCTKEDTTEDPPVATEKAITAFVLKKNDQSSFPAGDLTVMIGEDSVKVELAAGTDLTNLIPEITFNGVSTCNWQNCKAGAGFLYWRPVISRITS